MPNSVHNENVSATNPAILCWFQTGIPIWEDEAPEQDKVDQTLWKHD